MTSSRGQAEYMPQAMGPNPYPRKTCCENSRIGLASGNLLPARCRLYELCAWLFSQVPAVEPAMDGTSGFQDVRSAASRSPLYWFLHELQHHIGAWCRYILHAHDLIAPFHRHQYTTRNGSWHRFYAHSHITDSMNTSFSRPNYFQRKEQANDDTEGENQSADNVRVW